MKLSSFLLFSFYFTATSVAAAPVTDPEIEAGALLTREAEAAAPRFHLKTKVKPGQHDKSEFNGRFLQYYHTAAAFAAVATTPNKQGSLKNYLNGTRLVQDVGFQQALNFLLPDYYSSWQPVQIQPNLGDKGFYFDGKKLKAKRNWKGWRICIWDLNVQQLFYITDVGNARDLATCANVDLIRVDV